MLLLPEDIKVEPSQPRGPPGGQHVGIGRSGVKVTHMPSGTVAICESCRSQHLNRAVAIRMIEAAITDPDFGR